VIEQLQELIGHYSVYNDANQAKKYTEGLSKLFSKCKETLKDSLQLEDYNDEGVVPVSAFDEAFSNLDINVPPELKDYLLYVIY
jgi:hypothetical protein